MKPLVYIETTIPSFYFEERSEPEMVARRNWTREWWQNYRRLFVLVTSEAVLAELGEGDYESKNEAIALLKGIDLLDVPDQVADIIDVYLDHSLMPRERVGDALHLALASYHKCDFLLTWNCRHIANANKFEHIRIINSRLGLFVPTPVTPMELCMEEFE
ncbi:type II toxin-antitoxin system VapC family toxin [Candidatus Sumerlaeota bacterium]|nr:type II toxin-antitoxin system VapC family toxin [Candidatus Sumerlaeota bacterium]